MEFIKYNLAALVTQLVPECVDEAGQGRPCELCDLLIMLHNIMNFLLYQIAVPLAALLFVIAGLMILISGANPQLRQTGKRMFVTTIAGLVIVFLAWVIVNTIINVLGGGVQPAGFPWPWNAPSC